MRKTWKRVLVLVLIVTMLATDSSLSEVIYAAGQSIQQSEDAFSADVVDDDTDDETNSGEGTAGDVDAGDQAGVNKDADAESEAETGEAAGVEGETGEAAGTEGEGEIGEAADAEGETDEAVDAEGGEKTDEATGAEALEGTDEVTDTEDGAAAASVDGGVDASENVNDDQKKDLPIDVQSTKMQLLNSPESKEISEEQQAIIDEAVKTYGDTEEKGSSNLIQYIYDIEAGPYRAGQEISITVSQTVNNAKLYGYNSGSRPLAEQIKGMTTTLTLPSNLSYTSCELNESATHLSSCTAEGNVLTLAYDEYYTMPASQTTSSFTIRATINGNGALGDGAEVQLDDITTDFSAIVPILDYSDSEKEVIRELEVKHCFEATDRIDSSINVSSPDVWGTIVSTDTYGENGNRDWYYDEDGNLVMTWTVAAALQKQDLTEEEQQKLKDYEKLYITDPELLKALSEAAGDPITDEVAKLQAQMNEKYAEPGRAPIVDFELVSKVSASKDGATIYPASLKIELLKGDTQKVHNEAEGALEAVSENEAEGVCLTNYVVTGDGEAIAAGAPCYSSYKVTAVFSKDEFISHFYDEIQNYTFTNEVTLTSRIAAVEEKEPVASTAEAEGIYGDGTKAYEVNLAQSVTMGNGMDFLYDRDNLEGALAPFLGSSEYKLYKLEEGGTWTDYFFFTKDKDGQVRGTDYQDTFTISSDGDGQNLGSTKLYLEEGTYKLELVNTTIDDKAAKLKGYSSNTSSADESIFKVGEGIPEDGGQAEVYIKYEAVGKRILFTLKDQDQEELPLAGAEYTLYQDGKEVRTLTSTRLGYVVFAALEAGTYTLKQTKAPEGYILDEKEYTIDTGAGYDETAGNCDELMSNYYPGFGGSYYQVLHNESNTHSGEVTIEKRLSEFKDGSYTTEPVSIENSAAGIFNQNTFQVMDNSSGEWKETPSDQISIGQDGMLHIRYMQKYQLDEAGKILKGNDGQPLFVQYKVVERLPDGYSNSSMNTGADTSVENGVNVITYPSFDVASAFGYGTETENGEEHYTYYNEKITSVTLKQLLFDEQKNPGNSSPDSGRTFKLFYKLDGSDELKEYTQAGSIEPTDASGTIQLSGLPSAMPDTEGNYKQVYWYLGENGISTDEQIEYKNGEEFPIAEAREVDGEVYHLIPFDFSESQSAVLEAYRLVLKAGVTIYKSDVDGNKISGASFKVLCKEEEITPNGTNSFSGIVFWVPMLQPYTIEEAKAPQGYMKGEVYQKDAILKEEERTSVTPLTYTSYTSLQREENRIVYVDSTFPTLEVTKFNYAYDGVQESRAEQEYEQDKVEFNLYQKKTLGDGTVVFEKADAVYDYQADSYTDSFGNGRLVQIKPGTEYYISEVFDKEDEYLAGYIDPVKLNGSSASVEGAVYQDGKVFYPLPEFKKDSEANAYRITNYSNTSGALKVKVEEMLLERPFEEGSVTLQATAVGTDGKIYSKEVPVTGGIADFENLSIFDENGNRLKYTVKQITDHPEYSHDSKVYENITLDIGKVTWITEDDNVFDFHEYPRVDVLMQVNWVQDLTYDQLSENEKPSAQEKLPGAVVNVYQKKTDAQGNIYYELVQTCTANENGTLIAEGLEEFEDYVFVKAGYDTEKHTDALNPDTTGKKDFDEHRLTDDPAAEPVTITPQELEEKYEYIPYHYNQINSSITDQVVSRTDTVTDIMIYHELWMQIQTSKNRYFAADFKDGRDGMFKITKDGDQYQYEQYKTDTFSASSQAGAISEKGTWTKEKLQEWIDKAEKDSAHGKVVYGTDGEPTAILFGNFYSGQDAMYNLYRIKMADLTSNEVQVDGDGKVTISIDFQKKGIWELVDDEMVTDESGQTISREQIADDSYIYFMVETKAPWGSCGLADSDSIMSTHYVTVYHKDGAEYLYEEGKAPVPVEDITFRCKTVTNTGAANSKDWVDTAVRCYDVNTDSAEVMLNKGAIGSDSDYTQTYGYVQFNKWKTNKAYNPDDTESNEREYTPVSSARFDLYYSKADHTLSTKIGRTYQTNQTSFSSDAYASSDLYAWHSYYPSCLNKVLSAYGTENSGPKSLTELRKKYALIDSDGKTVLSIDTEGINQYIRNAMEAEGAQYATMFYISNVITNTAMNAEEILTAADARKDTYTYWGFNPNNPNASSSAAILGATEVLETAPAYFDLFDTEGKDKNIAIGFAQQVAYNYCACGSAGDSANYAVADGFPLDGNGVSADTEENAYGKRTGIYRFVYMHCYIKENYAPAGTFLNDEPKDFMFQFGVLVHRKNNSSNWGSWGQTYTMGYMNSYVGKSNLNTSNNFNRTWYYSDSALINQLGDVDGSVYNAHEDVGSVKYTARAKYSRNDTDNINRYLNRETSEKQTIKYEKLTREDTGYYSGRMYLNQTQAGFTVKVQSLGYPSLLGTYGKTDNELQMDYESENMVIRSGLLAGEYKLQKMDESDGTYKDFVYPQTVKDNLGHFRTEEESEDLCKIETYTENTDTASNGASPYVGRVYTFPQGLGVGVYRFVPCADDGGTLISAEKFSLNDRYYDTYMEDEAYRYFTVARTSADQYVDIFYPELPNLTVIKRENSAEGNPLRTSRALAFELTGNGYRESSIDKPGNMADFRLLKEGSYTLEEILTAGSGVLIDDYYKTKVSGIQLHVIEDEHGNKKTQQLVGSVIDEHGVTVSTTYEVDAPVFHGYEVTASGSIAAPDNRVTDSSGDATATFSSEMATTFRVYVSNPIRQTFQVRKMDALTGRGLQNAEFKVYYRPFEENSITVDPSTSNNTVTLKAAPAEPELNAEGDPAENTGWRVLNTYISNSNGLLMEKENETLGVNGAPGWYYLVETNPPSGMSYDIAEPILFAFTGTLAVDDQSEGSVRVEDGKTRIEVQDSDKIELNVSKFFAASALTSQHKVDQYRLALYTDEECSTPAKLYDYQNGRYTGRSGSEILSGKDITVGAGSPDMLAGSGKVYVDYNESGVYYLQETMTAADEKEAALWIAACAQMQNDGVTYQNAELKKAEISGKTVTVVWALSGFNGNTVNRDHTVTARVWNTYASASVKMFKTIYTDTDHALAGATFRLEDLSGKVLDTAVSGTEKQDGSERYNVEFTVGFVREEMNGCNLLSGKPIFSSKNFVVREIAAPEGYQVSDTTMSGSVMPGATCYLKGNNNEDFIDRDGVTIGLTKYDNVASNPSRKVEKDQGFALYVKNQNGDWQPVGETLYTSAAGNIIFPAVSVGDADGRYVYALVYKGAKAGTEPSTYGIDRVTIRVNGVDHVIAGTKEGDTTYYVLNDNQNITFVAGMTYQVTVYDIPKSTLTVKKQILDKENHAATGTAVYGLHKIKDGEILDSPEQVKAAIQAYTASEYETSGSTRASWQFKNLEAGRYLVWEISAGNTIINLDEAKVEWYQIVEVDPSNNYGEKNYEAVLKNKSSSVVPALEKTVQPSSVGSLIEQGTELTYTITPSLKSENPEDSQRALTSYVVTDSGLSFYKDVNASGIIEKEQAPKYCFTTLTLTQPSYANGEAGSFAAEVTFIGKDGEETRETYNLPLTNMNITDKKAVAFRVSYTDTVYAAAHSGYAAGEELIPGTITVQAKVEKCVQSPELTEVRHIKNNSEFSISYREWGKTFAESADADTKSAEEKAEASTAVSKVDVPVLSIEKKADITGKVSVGAALGYEITVSNKGNVPMKNAVLVDDVPEGLSIDTGHNGWFTLGRYNNSGGLKEILTGTDVNAAVTAINGRRVLIFRLQDELAAGEYYLLKLNKSHCTVTSSALQADMLQNHAYVTALEKSYCYNQNQTGNAFKDSSANEKGIDNSAMPAELLTGVEEYLKAELCGVLAASAENEVAPGIGFVPVKGEHGDLDGENVWISDLNSVAQVSQSDGSIEYRLSVTNAVKSEKKNIVMFDILPYEGDNPGSQWTLYADTEYEVKAVKTTAEKEDEVLSADQYTVAYGNWDPNVKATDDAVSDYQKIKWDQTNAPYNAVRIVYEEGLRENETLTVTIRAKLPEDADTEDWIYKEAINQFGVFNSQDSEQPDTASDVYSNKVKAQLVPPTVGLSGKVWIDTNQNHIQDEKDVYDYTVVEELLQTIRMKVSGYLMSSSTAISNADTEVDKKDGTYQFIGLTPARPVDDLNKLYVGGSLNPSSLRGAAISYRLELASGSADSDLIHLVNPGTYAPYSYANGNAQVDEGYWEIQTSDGKQLETVKPSMVTDSDIRPGTGLNGTSDQFFLFSAKNTQPKDTITNDSADAGIQINRQITVTKEDSLGNRLSGVAFDLYEYDLDDVNCTGNGKKINEEPLTTGADGQISFVVNYFKNYKLTETFKEEGYSGQTKLTSSYSDISQGAAKEWIIRCNGTGTSYSRLREDMTITNVLSTGAIRFDKRKELAEGGLAEAAEGDGFQFTLTYQEGNTAIGKQAWNAYLEKIANQPQLLTGCTYIGQSGQGLTVKVTKGTTVISGLPMGTYRLQEISKEGYVPVDEVEVTLSQDQQTIQIYNKDTGAEGQNLVVRTIRSVKKAVQNLFRSASGTTASTDKAADTNLLINYLNKAGLQLVKTGNAGTGDQYLAGAEFTLYKDAEYKEEVRRYTSTADAAGVTIEFAGLETGSHTFYLKETNSPGDLWGVNAAVWTLQVTVAAGKQPTVEVTGTGNNWSWRDGTLTVKDTYLKREGTISVQGTKNINGKPMSESALNETAKESFAFAIYQAEPVAGTTDYTVGEELKGASVELDADGNGSFTFDKFATYDETMHNKTFYYAVREEDVAGAYSGYLTKDSTWYVLAVNVQNADEAGKMKAELAAIYRSGTAVDAEGKTTLQNTSAAPNGLVFNNTYTTVKQDYSLKVKKELTGRKLKADEFRIILRKLYKDETGTHLLSEKEEETVVNANGIAEFKDALADFTGQQFYYYQVTEAKPVQGADGTYKKDGVTYDTSDYYLLFHVTDDGKGSMTPVLAGVYKTPEDCLAAESSYSDQTGRRAEDHTFDLTAGDMAVVFKNTYEVAPAKLKLTVGKKLDGRNIGGNEFKVEIAGDENVLKGVNVNPYISAEDNSNTGTAAFEGLTFIEAGTYTFTVSETQNAVPHVEYDKKYYTIQVTVADGEDGQLYVTEVTSWVSDPTASEAIVVYKAAATAEGMKDGDLDLSGENTSGHVIFRNHYTSSVKLKIGGNKTVTAPDGTVIGLDQLKEKLFKMKLQQTDASYNIYADGTAKETRTNPDGNYTFESLLYDETSLYSEAEGYKDSADFYYLITEEAAGTGYQKNTQSYKLHVILTRETDGSLSLRVEGEDGSNKNLTSETDTDGKTQVYALSGQNFTNIYSAEGALNLNGSKKLEGLNLADGLFQFEVVDESGAVVSRGTNSGGNTGTIVFEPDLTYSAAHIGKTFHYTVRESWSEDLTNAGYSQLGDNSHSLDVVIADGGNGKLSVTAAVDENEDKTVNSIEGKASITDKSWLSFRNKYSIDELKAQFTAYKSMNGNADLSAYTAAAPEFYFSLYEAEYKDGSWTKKDVIASHRKIDLSTHSVMFNDVVYDAESLKDPENPDHYLDALTKYYLISEDALDSQTAGKHFAGTNEQVLVKVDLYKTSGGALQLNTSYAKNFASYDPDGTDVSMFSTEDTYHTINNTYTDSLALDLSGQVSLESDIRDMTDQSFTVKVTGENTVAEYSVGGNGIADGTKSVAYSSANVLSYNQSDVGRTYTYTVTQTKLTKGTSDYDRSGSVFTGASGYTADEETYTVTVKISVDEDGNLKAEYQVVNKDSSKESNGSFTSADQGEKKISGLDFTNQYEAKGKIQLQEDTTFRAVAGTNTTVQEWLTASGEPGFVYKVYAVSGENGTPESGTELVSSTDDETAYASSMLTQTADHSKHQNLKEPTNLYQAGKDYTDIQSKEGVYYYYVEQVVPAEAVDGKLNGLTYGYDGTDTVRAYIVKATLTDTEGVDGTLKVAYEKKEVKEGAVFQPAFAAENGNMLYFTNTYTASGTVNMSGTKTLKNRDMKADEFTFRLKLTKAENNSGITSELGNLVLEVGNPAAKAGQKSDAFQWKMSGKEYTDGYTAVGTYTYQAEEPTAKLPEKVTVDKGTDTLTVTVTDGHNGTLHTQVAGSREQDGSASFENTYAAAGSITLGGTKTINGGTVDGYANNRFKFTLYEADIDGNFTKEIGTASSDGSTGAFGFAAILYTQKDMNDPGTGAYRESVTHTYRLQETEAVTTDVHYGMSKVSYDIEVTLKDNQKGTIDCWISKITNGEKVTDYNDNESDQKKALDSLTFDNTYSTTVQKSIGGKKTASGFTFTDGQDSVTGKTFHYENFSFLLYNCDADGETAANAQPIDIARLKADGTFTFDPMTFRYKDGTGKDGDDTGVHYYKIVEAVTGKYTTAEDSHMPDHNQETLDYQNVSDMIYSDISYVVKVDVAYESATGELKATPTVVSPNGIAEVNFTNTYPTGTFTPGEDGAFGMQVISAYEAEPGTDTTYGQSGVKYSYTMTPVGEDGSPMQNGPIEVKESTADMSAATYAASAPADGSNINAVSAKVTFDAQTVHNTDDRYYKIVQNVASGRNPGITFEEGYYIIKVTTEKDAADAVKLNSTVSEIKYYDKGGNLVETLDPATDTIRFTNVYHADPIKLSFETTKVLTGRYMFADEFSFTLTGTAGTDVYGYTEYSDTKKNTAAAADTVNTVTFKEDTLNGVGTYSYTLKENASKKASVTDDMTEYTKAIVVEDNHTGKLVFAANSGVTEENGTERSYSFDRQKGDKAAAYVNTYTSSSGASASGDLVLKGTKTINGLAVDDSYTTDDGKEQDTYLNKDGEFSFTLTETNASGEVLQKGGDEKQFEITAIADGTGQFKLTIPYTQADMKTADGKSGDFAANGMTVVSAGGAVRKSEVVYHYYQLVENDTKDGYGKSDKNYQIKVALTDNYDGTITASVEAVQDKTNGNMIAGNSPAFDNAYKAEGSITLKGTKLTKGFGLNEPDTYVYADEFKFELYESDQDGRYEKDAEPLQTTALDTKEEEGRTEYQNTFTFAPISYELGSGQKDVGDHYYVIRETKGSTKGMVYDTREYLVRVTVSDAGSGQLNAVVSNASQLTEHKLLGFRWTTTSTVKYLSFVNVYQSGGIDLYATNRYVAENGTDTPLRVLNEVQGDEKTTFRFKMNLSNESGEIVDTAGLEDLRLSETKTRSYQDNDYTTPAALADGGTEEATTFDFLHMKQNDLNVLKEWLHDLNFHSTGKFYIRMDQVLPEEKADGVTYDTGYYLAEITVTEPEADDNGDASDALEAWISSVGYYNAEGKLQNTVTDKDTLNDPKTLAETIVFTNVYHAEETGLALQAAKMTDNRSMAANEFRFTISGNGEAAADITASNEAAGAAEEAKIVFDRMIFDGIGTYTYTLAEKEEGLGGIDYDNTVYTFTVEVTDDHVGGLHNAVTSIMRDGEELLEDDIRVNDGKEAVTVLADYIKFSNHYTTGTASVALDGTKTINGRGVELFRNNLFTFDLFPAEYEGGVYTASGEAVDTAISDIQKGIFRLEEEFGQEDLFTEGEEGERIWNQTVDYYYLISERASEDTGYQANRASIGVTVTLSDNLDGTLTAKITDMKVQSGTEGTKVSGFEADRGSFCFDNTYKAEGKLVISGSKKMEGADLSTMENGKFTFEIVDENGTVVGTATNGTDGKILFTIPCDESFIGVAKRFILREVDDQKNGITYDATEYQLSVTGEDAGNGTLNLTAELLKDGKRTDVAEFVNIYKSKKKHHGSGSNEPTAPVFSEKNIVTSPKTGDETGLLGYVLLMFASACGIFTFGKKRRRKGSSK